jgi:SNF2 family DNA or RNA helicase
VVAPAKIDALAEYLLEAVSEGHRALLFSQVTGLLRLVRARCSGAVVGDIGCH